VKQLSLATDSELAVAINADLQEFAKRWKQNKTIGNRAPIDAYCDVLLRGGKRLRGVLAMRSYYAHGGKNDAVALGAARVFEIIQTSLLIVDDIADRSRLRRGGPSAHVLLETYAKEHNLKGNALRYGEVQAMNIAYSGPPQAIIELLALPVDAEVARRAGEQFNENVLVTINGQLDDVFNEVTRSELSEEAIESVLHRKTARYTFLSPIELGAQLAGAPGVTPNLYDYAIHAGCAYQIADDIISTFGITGETGKGNNDDIREGKITLLAYYALHHGSEAQKIVVTSILGNEDSTAEDCDRVRHIFEKTGALQYARDRQLVHEKAALAALEGDSQTDPEFIGYLAQLADYLVNRKS
jgi:geranylgeranyl diphosphate synthase type I